MKDLPETQQKLVELKGETLGIECMLNAILRALPLEQLAEVLRGFDAEVESAKVAILNSERASDAMIDGLDTYAQQVSARLDHFPGTPRNTPAWWRNRPG